MAPCPPSPPSPRCSQQRLAPPACCSYARLARCSGHSSYITHLDWSLDGAILQSTCGAYELLYFEAGTGKQVVCMCCTAHVASASGSGRPPNCPAGIPAASSSVKGRGCAAWCMVRCSNSGDLLAAPALLCTVPGNMEQRATQPQSQEVGPGGFRLVASARARWVPGCRCARTSATRSGRSGRARWASPSWAYGGTARTAPTSTRCAGKAAVGRGRRGY